MLLKACKIFEEKTIKTISIYLRHGFHSECEDVEVIGLIDPNLNSLKTLFSSLDTVTIKIIYLHILRIKKYGI